MLGGGDAYLALPPGTHPSLIREFRLGPSGVGTPFQPGRLGAWRSKWSEPLRLPARPTGRLATATQDITTSTHPALRVCVRSRSGTDTDRKGVSQTWPPNRRVGARMCAPAS